MRDDAPDGGATAPATLFRYSGDRGGAHPQRHLAAYIVLLPWNWQAAQNLVAAVAA